MLHQWKKQQVSFQKVREGRDIIRDIEHMNEQMTAINDAVERIFDDIDRQSETTKEFNDQVSNIADTYGMLTKECTETGTHIFKIGRYIDTCRSDMFREAGAVTTQDMLRIFEIDHFILMWRVYNNIVDFERLKITQLNNPDTCKIGKWMHSQTDTRITTSSQFKKLDAAHRLTISMHVSHGMPRMREISIKHLKLSRSVMMHIMNIRRQSLI